MIYNSQILYIKIKVLLVTDGNDELKDNLFSNGIRFASLDSSMEPEEFQNYIKN
jgi:hypothetical protein